MLVAEKQQYSYDYYQYNRTENKKKKVVKQKRTNRIKPILFIIVCFCMTCFYFTIYTKSIIASRQLSILNEQLQDQIKTAEYLKTQIITSYNLKEIEDIAINKLGMQYPEPHQIVYVDLPVQQMSVEDKKVAMLEKGSIDNKNDVVQKMYNLFD